MWAYDITVSSVFYIRTNQYLNGELSLDKFEKWFYQNLFELMELPLSEELFLAGEIQLGLAEISNGDITEEKFKEQLSSFLKSGAFITSGKEFSTYVVSSGSGSSATVMSGNIITYSSPSVMQVF